MEGVRTSERVDDREGGLVNHTTCPRAHKRSLTMSTNTVVHAFTLPGILSLSPCVCGETLRLALCGPDYNGISAAAYYTGL